MNGAPCSDWTMCDVIRCDKSIHSSKDNEMENRIKKKKKNVQE